MNPLVAKLRELLAGHGPQSPDHLRRLLRRAGQNVAEDLIEREMRANHEHFRPTGTGAWDLAENVAAPELPDHATAGQRVDPLITDGLDRSFVVVDLETTGLDAESDEIVQIAAVRYREGEPVAGLNHYTRTSKVTVPTSLRVRLGWERLRDDERVELAYALGHLRDFVGNDVVVAWNASFEKQMLAAAGIDLPRLVDGLALAMLELPVGPHRLSVVAQRLDLLVGPWPTAVPIEGGQPASFEAHDAFYDSYVTGLVHSVIASRIGAGASDGIAQLLPEMGRFSREGRPPRAATPQRSGRPHGDSAANLAAVIAGQGREVRSAQKAVARLCERGLRGAPTLIEAPTGTGKTLAYIAAALALVRSGERVALVTAFKNLQDQLLDELDATLATLDVAVDVAVLKGGDNYLCTRRVKQMQARFAEDDLDLRYLCAVLLRLTEGPGVATREDISWWLLERFPRARSLLDEVAVSCTHRECGRALAIEAANRAQILVLNQVQWLAPPDSLTPISTVVVDEAHDLENMATLAFTDTIGTDEIRVLANRLDPAGRRGLLDATSRYGPSVKAARHLARRARQSALDARRPLARFAAAVSPEVRPEDGGKVRLRRAPKLLHPAAWTAAEDSLRDLREALRALAAEVGELAGDDRIKDPLIIEDLYDVTNRVQAHEELLWRLEGVRDIGAVHYLEVDGDDGADWRLAKAPINVAALLEPIWNELAGFALLSATLQTGRDDFTYTVDRLGLRDQLAGGCCALTSDFPYDTNLVFGIARWFDPIPTPRFMEEFQAETAREVELLARFGEGRLLALFTARRRLDFAADTVAKGLATSGIPVLQQGHGARAALLEEFRDRNEAILLGTRSFWQGVDVPGPSLSFLLLEKLPYPHLRDPIVEARLELVRRTSGNEFDDYLLPQMIVTLKQGYGRLIRNRQDRGAVILLDRRLHTKAYQRRVFESLPGFAPRDIEAERSRRAFYERIDALLPGLISDVGRALLDKLPDSPAGAFALPAISTGGDRTSRRPDVLAAMALIFGENFADFRSQEQEELFWRILDGDDVLGLLPTGAGKSLPFQLAALVTTGLTIVISPLVALMRDQVESLLARGVRAVGALIGAMSADERDEVLRQAGTDSIRLLYVAPERLRDPVFIDHLANLPVNRLVVDEAHCVSLWGPSFRPDFLAIRAAFDSAGYHHIPVAALTATATPEIELDIRRSLRIEHAVKVAMPFARPELRFAVIDEVRGRAGDRIRNEKERSRLLIRMLTAAEHAGHASIVYVPTIRQADQIANQLRQVGLLARSYHGQLDAWSRQDVEELFRDGEIDTVVATKAFGMGIDRSDVRLIVHIGHPADLESYYQEAGRAGRDGDDALCILLGLRRDRRTQDWFIDQVANLDDHLRAAHERLRELGAGEHVVDLAEFGASIGIDDETQVRVVLHYLEAADCVRRSTDQTTRARILAVTELRDSALKEALRAAGAHQLVSTEIELAEIAEQLAVSPVEVERRLLEASRSGEIVFRPIQRGARLIIENTLGQVPDTAPVVAVMRRKLDQMVQYSDTNQCRQALLRSYLGETSPQPCGRCDVCDRDGYPRPWMTVTRDTLPDADRLFDEPLTVLAAVDWNASEAAAGRNPYGRTALAQLLAADRFGLGRYADGTERTRRIRRAEASPYWGALALVTNPSARIGAAMDSLLERGELDTGTHEPTGIGASTSTYEYLVLTETGRARMERGELTE